MTAPEGGDMSSDWDGYERSEATERAQDRHEEELRKRDERLLRITEIYNAWADGDRSSPTATLLLIGKALGEPF